MFRNSILYSHAHLAIRHTLSLVELEIERYVQVADITFAIALLDGRFRARSSWVANQISSSLEITQVTHITPQCARLVAAQKPWSSQKKTTVALIAGALLNPSSIYIHFSLLSSSIQLHIICSDIFRFRGLRLLLGGGGTSNNLDKLTGNDGLASTVEENLELGDHLAGVLGGVVHGVAAGGLLAGVALGKSPEEGVGKSVLAEAGEDSLVDLEGREVG